MKVYIGIADAHGIESFHPISELTGRDTFIMKMRAESNRQRHTVIYKATITDDDANRITRLLSGGYFKDALNYIKSHAKSIGVQKGHESSWEQIPNDRLDPYWG